MILFRWRFGLLCLDRSLLKSDVEVFRHGGSLCVEADPVGTGDIDFDSAEFDGSVTVQGQRAAAGNQQSAGIAVKKGNDDFVADTRNLYGTEAATGPGLCHTYPA